MCIFLDIYVYLGVPSIPFLATKIRPKRLSSHSSHIKCIYIFIYTYIHEYTHIYMYHMWIYRYIIYVNI